MPDLLKMLVQNVREGGIVWLLRKAFKLIFYLLLVLPLVILIRLLCLFMVFRFAPLHSVRIGHFSVNTELYLCKRDFYGLRKRIMDIFFFDKIICNNQLAKIWKRQLPIFEFARHLNAVNCLLPGGAKHTIPESESDRDIEGIFSQTKIHLRLNDDEEAIGKEKLRTMGVEAGKPFVCFACRGPAYLNSILPKLNFAYHSYRDTDINSYLLGFQELVGGGYVIFRMGAVVDQPLFIQHDRIIDYASLHRTDLMDIYLVSKCSFYLADTCGFAGLAMSMRRPFAAANVIPLEYALLWMRDYVCIPKKLWIKDKKRFMTFREMFDSGLGRCLNTKEFRSGGVEIVDNTSQEICDLVVEMDERLRGAWKGDEEDIVLQKKFIDIFPKNELNKVIVGRIGARFLRENKDLLA